MRDSELGKCDPVRSCLSRIPCVGRKGPVSHKATKLRASLLQSFFLSPDRREHIFVNSEVPSSYQISIHHFYILLGWWGLVVLGIGAGRAILLLWETSEEFGIHLDSKPVSLGDNSWPRVEIWRLLLIIAVTSLAEIKYYVPIYMASSQELKVLYIHRIPPDSL